MPKRFIKKYLFSIGLEKLVHKFFGVFKNDKKYCSRGDRSLRKIFFSNISDNDCDEELTE